MKQINCILLIDDSHPDNEYHKIIIAESGKVNQVKVAMDGIYALEYIMNTVKPGMEKEYPKPELMFLDINMPRMNGFEFLEKYQQLSAEYKSSLIITMLTTSANPEDEKKAMSYKEVLGYKVKPLTDEMLTEIIDDYYLKINK